MPGFGRKKNILQSSKQSSVKGNTSSGGNIQKVWNQYLNSALAIRGTDGQEAASQTSISDYIKSDSFGNRVSNPWNNFTSNIAPAFSASLLSSSAKYPILWYVYAFVDPFFDNSGVPPIQNRNQGAFTLSRYQFAGASLWDGNSNSDITGSSSIPAIFERGGNRGTSENGYSAQLPFVQPNPQAKTCKVPVGSAKYTCPTTNNVNKAYNPTFNARNDGNPVGGSEGDVIMKNICRVKGEIWDKFIPDPVNDPCGSKSNLLVSLQQNWGSGFEIEAYMFPETYSPSGSMWLEGAAKEQQLRDSRFKISDVYSINIASDSKDYESWISQHPDETSVSNAYKKIYNDAVTGGGDANAQWVNLPSQNIKLPLTLITGIMLPAVNLTGAGGSTAKEFCSYLQQGYGPLTNKNFYQVGWYTPVNDELELFVVPLQATN